MLSFKSLLGEKYYNIIEESCDFACKVIGVYFAFSIFTNSYMSSFFSIFLTKIFFYKKKEISNIHEVVCPIDNLENIDLEYTVNTGNYIISISTDNFQNIYFIKSCNGDITKAVLCSKNIENNDFVFNTVSGALNVESYNIDEFCICSITISKLV